MARTARAVLCTLTLLVSTEGFLPVSSPFAGKPAAVIAGGSSVPLPGTSQRSAAAGDATGAKASAAAGGGGLRMSGGTAKKIVVLGGDGFCGWPTCLHLSEAG